ncbi:hypothetical protein HYPSUDRAFT_66074 [Hypholoma sublateritium FD-334 SS-4]|uniref:Uncharacterized protein n=1 Tax=Hypholoma sublateritium (strain FD-334 SS-4) TaxID=945553 RepID=A0A0D2MJ25_HYPSF|nr:hypothetical protein HYPSUDRAFT_66074 [Hypholoma sublateritium FD-334 SS-4]
MFFRLATVFVTATAIAASTVPVARQVGAATTCTLVLTPQSPVSSSTNLLAEFNLLIGRNLVIEAEGEGGDGSGNNAGSTFTTNADGTFTVEDTVSAGGETAAETAAIITGWVGEIKDGFTINWLVDAASCN